MEPQKINVIVYCARSLQPKKGPDVTCKPHVVFGIGKERFRTEDATGTNPTWNEESSIQVTKPAPLVFTVVDRGESLGAVSVPLRQISSASPKRRWEPLTRNNAADIGELCFDCWVTAYRQSAPKWNLKTTGLKKDLRVERRRSLHNTSVSLKGSRSMENLHSMCNNFDVINTLTLGMLRRSHSGILATDHTADLLDAGAERPQSLTVPGPQSRALPSRSAREDEVILTVPEHRAPVSAPPVEQCAVPGDQPGRGDSAPEITGLSPKFGAASGGTRITLRGQNLGASREDIISLSVCGCDLLPNLQYFSSGKLVVVTRPWRGSGPVVIVTRSGGRAASTVKFSFEGRDSNEQEPLGDEPSKDKKRGARGKVSRSELLSEITRLRQEVLELSADNERLRKYIDHMLPAVMEKFPHLLENLTTSL